MSILVLLRHGESAWNEANTFTGWVEVGLSERGRRQLCYEFRAGQPGRPARLAG